MKYKFTNEHKQWIKQLVTATGSEALKLWLSDVRGNVAKSQLDSLQGLAPESHKEQVKAFINWITTGEKNDNVLFP